MLNSPRNVAQVCAPSALAGYVDGIGFIHLGGLLAYHWLHLAAIWFAAGAALAVRAMLALTGR